MTKKEALKQLIDVRRQLINVHLEYNDIIPDNIERMKIKDCIQKLSLVIATYYLKK